MTYVYAVSAVNAVGEGPPSSETSCVCRSKPSAPSGLTADRSEGGVSLAWSAPSQDGGSPVISYVVYRGSSSGQLSALATLEAVLAYEDLEPPVSSVVYYSVSAVNSVGEGERCEEGSLVLATKASAPTNVTVSNLDRAVRLSWEAPADDGGLEVTSYVIYRTSSNQTRMKVAEVNATSWVDTGLTNGETYNYNIAAVNACGESDQTCLAVGAPASYLRAQSNVGAALPDLGSLLAISALAAAAFAAAYLVIGRRRGRR
jgi:predicted phage tail protein